MANFWIAFFLSFAAGVIARSDAGVAAGEFTVEPPTLICLGFEWQISGDSNRNASVEVSYRETGEDQWKRALPLLRLGGERVFREGVGVDYTVPHMFAGSILDLEPDTAYECRFELKDPEGVEGESVRVVTARTRGEPKEAPGGQVLHVYPPDWKREKEEPAFASLAQLRLA